MRLLFIVFCIAASTAFTQVASGIFTPKGLVDPNSENKLVVQNYYKAFQENNVSALLNVLAPNYGIVNANLVQDTSYYRYPTMSKNQKIRMQAFHHAFPELTIQIMELVAENNRVFAYVTYSGIQRGAFLGIIPTGKPILIRQFAIFSIQNGRISHITEMDNEYSVMEQIGYVLLK
ncbi:MAG: ester cyclase [Chlamydiia bacterium]|nr:ester cyclase [Chlamydiia bacterium]